MPKLLLLVVFGPLLLVAVVLTSPFTCLYFCFDRACDCIEEFKPHRRRRTSSKSRAGMAKQLGALLNKIPTSASNSPANPSE